LPVGLLLIVIAIVLFVIGLAMRRRPRLGEPGAKPIGRLRRGAPEPQPEMAAAPRPRVVEMHVIGEEARVTFDVPIAEDDEILNELLTHEAIEVVREKRHSLPIDQVTTVVALAGRGDVPREVGRSRLDAPGQLPPRLDIPSVLHLAHIGFDPIDQQFTSALPEHVPAVASTSSDDVLEPVGTELRLPRAIDLGLRTQGIDPLAMSAGQLVTGTLSLFGYKIAPGARYGTFIAEKAGVRTYIREDQYQKGGYPEVEDLTVREFMVEFMSSQADRGLLVSDKYGPFEIYEKEKREPRVRFVTRERLQRFVDSLALG